MFAHTALASQWIILAALALWLYHNDLTNKEMLVFWSILLALAPALHMYFVPMLGVQLVFFCLMKFQEKREISKSLMLFLVPCLFSVLVMFLLGVFHGGVKTGDISRIDIYTMNLNSFVNPLPIDSSARVSLILKPLPVDCGQYEGGCYLGVGIIAALLVIMSINLITRFKSKTHISYRETHPLRFYLCLMALAFYIFSLGVTVKLGNIPITKVWYPGFTIKLIAIFSVVGRFIWPVYYLIFLYVIVKISEFAKKKRILLYLVPVIVSVNVIDQILMITDYHNYYTQVHNNIPGYDEKWNRIANKHAVLCGSVGSDFIAIGKMLVRNNNTLNSFYLARSPYEKIQNYFNEITNKLITGDKIDDDIIFVFRESDDVSFVNGDIFEMENIDGFVVIINKNVELFGKEKKS